MQAEFLSDLLAEGVNRCHLVRLFLIVPEGPAIAGLCPLNRSADLMDRAGDATGIVLGNQGAVGTYPGMMAAAFVKHQLTGAEQTLLHQHAEGNARGLTFAFQLEQVRIVDCLNGANAVEGELAVTGLALDTDEVTTETLGRRTGGATAEERI